MKRDGVCEGLSRVRAHSQDPAHAHLCTSWGGGALLARRHGSICSLRVSALQQADRPLWESPARPLSSPLTVLSFPGRGAAPADAGPGEEGRGRGAQPGE